MATDDEAIVAEELRMLFDRYLTFDGRRGQVDHEIDRHPTIPQAAGFGVSNTLGEFDVVVIRRG